MSAIIGTFTFFVISFNASEDFSSGTDTRTKSAPVSANMFICLIVSLIFDVIVLVDFILGAVQRVAGSN